MGEEEKKPEEPKPPAPAEESKKKEEDAAPKPPPPEDDKKPKSDDPPPPPPPPPQEIILKVYMHCEGCARKVRRCLKGFDGVEDVMTDCKTSKVVVKGEKADPLKVLARIQRKSHRQVELLSPIPPPPPPPEEKPDQKEPPKPEEKKEEPPVIRVMLGVYMHCEACAQELKKRIQKMKGVESVVPDLKSSQVAVKGVLDPEKLIDYVHKRTGKHATIIKVEPEKKEEEKKDDEKKEEKKPEEAKEPKKEEEGEKEKKEAEAAPAAKTEAVEAGDETKMELKKNETQYYYYPHYQQLQLQQQQQQQVYPQRFVQEYQHEYPSPQMFSDENPNACTVM